MKIREAAEYLDLSTQRVRKLVEAGTLKRQGVDRPVTVTAESVEAYKDRIVRRCHSNVRWPPTRADQRAIVQTLLMAGVMSKQDIADHQRAKLIKALQKL